MKKRKGQALVEYALILALVSTFCFIALSNLGHQVKLTITRVAEALQHANGYYSQQVDPPAPTPDPIVIYPCNNGHGHGHGYGRCR